MSDNKKVTVAFKLSTLFLYFSEFFKFSPKEVVAKVVARVASSVVFLRLLFVSFIADFISVLESTLLEDFIILINNSSVVDSVCPSL